jgi:hypothetical protein
MKKTTKTVKTPAPATKLTAPAPALKSAVAPKIKKPAAPLPTATAALTKPKGSRVTITAKVDVGFGNALFIRGEGAGLSWNKGTPLDCASSDTWSIVLPSVEKPLAFKLLRNDEAWSAGDDYHAAPGDTVTVTPAF